MTPNSAVNMFNCIILRKHNSCFKLTALVRQMSVACSFSDDGWINGIWTRGNKTFFVLNSAENEICYAYKNINTNNLNFFFCKTELSMKFFLLINIKMPTIVCILIFINRQKFKVNWVEHEKSFITWGPGHSYIKVFVWRFDKVLIAVSLLSRWLDW